MTKKIKIKINSKMSEEELKDFRNWNELDLERFKYKDLESFKMGFNCAKFLFRKFLLNKQMGYGEAFLFKISEFDVIGLDQALFESELEGL